ncbi:hypothetical protein JCM8097_002833 [Rhodosporidiobolus ruineniae]
MASSVSSLPHAPYLPGTGAILNRACTRCHQKKVKCDGHLPTCGPCTAAKKTTSSTTCDVEQCLVWSNACVEDIKHRLEQALARVKWLEGELDDRTGGSTASIETGGLVTRDVGGAGTAEAGGGMVGSTGASVEVDRLATEVGMLALRAGSGAAPYVGSASGITMARVLASAILLDPDADSQDPLALAANSLPPQYRTTVQAGLPPFETAKQLLHLYLTRVHIFYPFLDLQHLVTVFSQFYPSSSPAAPAASSAPPTPLTPFDRFLLFHVLAVGSIELRSFKPESGQPLPVWTPAEYFATAATFIPLIARGTGMDTLVMAVGVCVYGARDPQSQGVNLWQWTSYAMSLAVELGCHRQNSAWPFRSDQTHYRRRIWWVTYLLERTVAVRLGRTLSIRDFAVDASWPRQTSDALPPSPLLPEGYSVSYAPAMHLCRLYQLAGMALETVYAARSRQRVVAQEETAKHAWTLQNALADWEAALPHITGPDTLARDVLTFKLYSVSLLVHRPSPSFPLPSAPSYDLCLATSRKAIDLADRMSEHEQLPVHLSTFLDLFLAGIVLMYCSRVSPLSPSAAHSALDPSLLTCSAVLSTLSQRGSLDKTYLALFHRVLGAFARACTPPVPPPAADPFLGVPEGAAASVPGLDPAAFWNDADALFATVGEAGMMELEMDPTVEAMLEELMGGQADGGIGRV